MTKDPVYVTTIMATAATNKNREVKKVEPQDEDNRETAEPVDCNITPHIIPANKPDCSIIRFMRNCNHGAKLRA